MQSNKTHKRRIIRVLPYAAVLSVMIMAFVFISALPAAPLPTAQTDNPTVSNEELQAEIRELRNLVNSLIQTMNDNNQQTNVQQPIAPAVHHPQHQVRHHRGDERYLTQSPARLDQAAQAALQRAGGGFVRHICIDWEGGQAVYHVRIYRNGNRMDYYLNRNTFEVVRERVRQHQNASPSSSSFRRRQLDVAPTLTFNQAAQVVFAYTGGGAFREISRSYARFGHGETPVFDVDIVTANGERWCFYVDIHTGEIVSYRRYRR
jgi:uncharacterized membrane protein YkoI